MIESIKNNKIKYLLKLNSKNNFRKKEGVFVVEGQQENELALSFNKENIEFYICEELYQKQLPNGNINLVTKEVYEKIAYRRTTEGVIGVYKDNEASLEDFKVENNTKIIALEGIEKPGNLGAILRSCEAFGIDAVIVTNTKVDFYNPNVIRSSVGCLFGMNIFSTTNEELYEFLQKNDISIFTTIMSQDAKMINEVKLSEKIALLFGTEHSGLSDFWINKGQNILIPMAGKIDSLNLSNAVAISCYEILRQKQI